MSKVWLPDLAVRLLFGLFDIIITFVARVCVLAGLKTDGHLRERLS